MTRHVSHARQRDAKFLQQYYSNYSNNYCYYVIVDIIITITINRGNCNYNSSIVIVV